MNEPWLAVVDQFHVKGERLLRPGRGSGPIENLVNIARTTNPVLLAVIAHLLLGDSRWSSRLMPEVDPIYRLIDFPLDVSGIHALRDHQLTLRTMLQTRLSSAACFIDGTAGTGESRLRCSGLSLSHRLPTDRGSDWCFSRFASRC